MPIPIQITNLQSRINTTPGQQCHGYNGNLNSWEHGLTSEFKQKMIKQYNTVGLLAQYETVNSPYYTQVQVDPEYIKFLQSVNEYNKCVMNML